MTRKEAEEAYIEKFGGLPIFLIEGASDEYVIKKLTECVESGKELEAEDNNIY